MNYLVEAYSLGCWLQARGWVVSAELVEVLAGMGDTWSRIVPDGLVAMDEAGRLQVANVDPTDQAFESLVRWFSRGSFA
jgi:hypothetical protein